MFNFDGAKVGSYINKVVIISFRLFIKIYML